MSQNYIPFNGQKSTLFVVYTLQETFVANWEETTNVIGELAEKFRNYNENTQLLTDIRVENTSEESLFEISSKVEHYHRNKNSNSILLFVTTILSIIFFFGSFFFCI